MIFLTAKPTAGITARSLSRRSAPDYKDQLHRHWLDGCILTKRRCQPCYIRWYRGSGTAYHQGTSRAHPGGYQALRPCAAADWAAVQAFVAAASKMAIPAYR